MSNKVSPEVKPIRVLIVDDEPDLREILEFELSDAGFQVETASNGEEGLAKLGKDRTFRVVVTDIRMPKMTGVEMLDRIQEMEGDRPKVVLMSGYPEVTVEDALDRGADAMFFKPIDLPAMISVIHSAAQPHGEKWTRRHQRYECELPVRILGENFSTRNLGRGGMFVEIPSGKIPPVGTEVDFHLEFTNRKWDPLEGRGEIRWVRQKPRDGLPTGVGIEFKELTDASAKGIAEFLNAVHTRAYIPRS